MNESEEVMPREPSALELVTQRLRRQRELREDLIGEILKSLNLIRNDEHKLQDKEPATPQKLEPKDFIGFLYDELDNADLSNKKLDAICKKLNEIIH